MSDERTAQTRFRRDALDFLLVVDTANDQVLADSIFMTGLLGDKAFADCLPAHDTPASVIEYFQRFNKPLPEQFCAKEAAPQASHEPPQEFSQTEEAPGQYGDDDGPGDGPFAQYEGDPGGGYESDMRRGRSKSPLCAISGRNLLSSR
jgi:hypothetical protein